MLATKAALTKRRNTLFPTSRSGTYVYLSLHRSWQSDFWRRVLRIFKQGTLDARNQNNAPKYIPSSHPWLSSYLVSTWILFHLGFTKSMYNWAIPVVRWEVTERQLSVYSSRSVKTVYRKYCARLKGSRCIIQRLGYDYWSKVVERGYWLPVIKRKERRS